MQSPSEFGSGWWLDGLQRVIDSSTGALLVQGNGDTLWFAKSGSDYLYAEGDTSYSTLIKTGGNTYTLTSKTGIVSNFSTTGLLTSIVDTNSNTISFAYADRNSDSIANELVSITDPFSRVTDFNCTTGKVSSIAHYSGRTTTLTTTRDNLGRAITIGNTINGLTPTVTLNQAFDSASNRTELKATSGSANDFKNTYQYDALQRLMDIIQQGQSGGNAVTSKHVTLSYYALSQRASLARYQSTGTGSAVASTDYTFDMINRLSTLTHKQGATTLKTRTSTTHCSD